MAHRNEDAIKIRKNNRGCPVMHIYKKAWMKHGGFPYVTLYLLKLEERDDFDYDKALYMRPQKEKVVDKYTYKVVNNAGLYFVEFAGFYNNLKEELRGYNFFDKHFNYKYVRNTKEHNHHAYMIPLYKKDDLK